MHADVEASYYASLEVLKSLGAKAVEISLPHTRHALAAYYIIVPAEASSNLARYDGVRYGHRTNQVDSLKSLYERSRAEGFGPEVKRRIMMGSYVLSAGYYDAYYLKAQQIRTLIADDFRAAFANHCDIIATPVSPTTAFLLGEKTNSPLEMYLADVLTVPINLAGLPAMSVPAGLDSLGLPIGLQLIGAPFDEQTLLNSAHAFLRQQPFTIKPLTGGLQ
jgi:aspartyl-tRNA(Asn)/glutamyl-tRNA(Gln) amidotransferase subunit A